MLGGHCMCTHQLAALFCMKWRGHHLEMRHQIKNPTLAIDAYLFEEQSRQISSWSDLKSLLMKRVAPTGTRLVATWDQFLIQNALHQTNDIINHVITVNNNNNASNEHNNGPIFYYNQLVLPEKISNWANIEKERLGLDSSSTHLPYKACNFDYCR